MGGDTGASSDAKTPVSLDEFLVMTAEQRSQLPKNRLKKLTKLADDLNRKAARAAEIASIKDEETRIRLEKARDHSISIDTTLPDPTVLKIRDLSTSSQPATPYVSKRVRISGWVHELRWDGKKLMFVVLRDGTGFLPCVLSNDLCLTYDAVTLHREAAVTLWGTIVLDPRAKGGQELQCDYWELVGSSPAEIEYILAPDSGPDVLLTNRHLVIRGTKTSSVLRMRSIITQCFREHLFDRGYVELSPPTLVDTNCEGGSDLFSFDYYGKDAYLTQSSQMYLETGIPAVGDCFCILPSYRAEKSLTRRHLSEFHHIEAECPFIDFEELLVRVEDLVSDVLDRVFAKGGQLLQDINPSLKPMRKPIKRMTYEEAIEFCRANSIYKEEETKSHFEFGDDIPEGPERKMTDMINEPILLNRFPASLKSFYMKKCEDDRRLTESVDLLVPGVGEVVGGSMRIDDLEELTAAYERKEMPMESYYWFTDQRKYGSCPHGGYGLGLERFCCYVLGIKHIRDVCLYPRYFGRISP